MGTALCTLFKEKPVRILYFGLDAAGKTTLLYRLKLGEVVNTIPTIGVNIESVEFNGIQMLTWDVGTRDKSRFLYGLYMKNDVDAVVFLVDSTDHERLQEAVEEFFRQIVYSEHAKVPVLVLANKQDVAGVLSPEQIKQEILKRGSIRPLAAMEVFPTVATSLEGVDVALTWLTSQLAVKLAKDNYLPSLSSACSIVRYPAVFLKNSFLGMRDLLSGGGVREKLTT